MNRDRQIALRANVPADKAEEATKHLRGYYAHIAALDACVARLRQAVAANGQGHDLRVCLRLRGHAAEPRDAP